MFALPFFRVTCLYFKVWLIVVEAHFFTFTVYKIRGIWIHQLTIGYDDGLIVISPDTYESGLGDEQEECCFAWKSHYSEGCSCLLYQVRRTWTQWLFLFSIYKGSTFLRSSLGNILLKPRSQLLIIIWNVEFFLYISALKITQRGDSRNSHNPV